MQPDLFNVASSKEAAQLLTTYQDGQVVEPIAYECRGCGKDSSYRVEHNYKIPRGWVENDRGVFCTSCKNKRRFKKCTQ